MFSNSVTLPPPFNYKTLQDAKPYKVFEKILRLVYHRRYNGEQSGEAEFTEIFNMGRKHKRLFLIGILAAIAAALIIWTVWGNVTIGSTSYTVVSSRLPAAFDHYKIVVVSDVHNAEYGENNSRLIRLVEEGSRILSR